MCIAYRRALGRTTCSGGTSILDILGIRRYLPYAILSSHTGVSCRIALVFRLADMIIIINTTGTSSRAWGGPWTSVERGGTFGSSAFYGSSFSGLQRGDGGVFSFCFPFHFSPSSLQQS